MTPRSPPAIAIHDDRDVTGNAFHAGNTDYKTIVSPRAGPTLTIDNFAPVNSEMYLTYFLAAGGSCENFRTE
jgi:hypothetical protein